MRTSLLGLALVGVVVLLAVAATSLLRGGRAASAAPERTGPLAGQATPAPGDAGAPLALFSRTALGPRLDAVEPPPEPESARGDLPFEWPLRDPPQVDGPRIESYYAGGSPEFLGTQVLAADGTWVRDGGWTAWYDNGQVCERGAYRGGVEDGPWEWFYEDGTRMASGAWVDGKRVGDWTFWHDDGSLGMVGSYADGAGNGLWTLYGENGWKQAEGPWVNGEPNGHWNVWNEDGTLDLEHTGTYVDGKKVD